MTIQEEIKEGVGRLLPPFYQKMDEVEERELMTNSMKRKEWFVIIEETATEILKYLDSKGVIVAEWHEGDFYDAFARLIEK